MRVFPTGRIASEVLNTLTPDEARWYFFFQARDIAARSKLIDLAEELYNEGESIGCAHLMNASLYLRDRAFYQEHVGENPRPGTGLSAMTIEDAREIGIDE
ncbi:MAG TPA: hypothetical protein VGM43_16580 [Bryobacteraceae bacterium]|jgi:hypothetical protein